MIATIWMARHWCAKPFDQSTVTVADGGRVTDMPSLWYRVDRQTAALRPQRVFAPGEAADEAVPILGGLENRFKRPLQAPFSVVVNGLLSGWYSGKSPPSVPWGWPGMAARNLRTNVR
ncbi:hypothetical protein [Sulfitobacter sediminilitoris]|uniref:hypothetical protein n=1 Tax=Sulfitobacter sediminilitoris TaxID=2698830 RepID=UPI003622C4C8